MFAGLLASHVAGVTDPMFTVSVMLIFMNCQMNIPPNSFFCTEIKISRVVLKIMTLLEMLEHGTFGVELELCVCLFDAIRKYNAIKEYISKQLDKASQRPIRLPSEMTRGLPQPFLTAVTNAATNRNPLFDIERMLPYEAYFDMLLKCGHSLGEKPPVATEFGAKNDYTQWAVEQDGSIRCGFEALEEKFVNDAQDEDEETSKEILREAAAANSGLIVPKDNPRDYVDNRMALCLEDQNMLSIEVVSRVYNYPKLGDFLTYMRTCIYNDNVVYELNTSQGLHISIGNSLINSGGYDPRNWVRNLVLLWWKYERDVLALVPKFRIDLDEGKYSAFARPLVTRFDSLEELEQVEEKTGVPFWELFYARQIEGLEIGQNLFSEDEDLKNVKYTTLNIKGIEITPKYDVRYTDRVFAEFRMVPASHNLDLMTGWIDLLSAFGALAMDDTASAAVINGDDKTRLADIFGPLKKPVTNAIKKIERSNKMEILLRKQDL